MQIPNPAQDNYREIKSVPVAIHAGFANAADFSSALDYFQTITHSTRENEPRVFEDHKGKA